MHVGVHELADDVHILQRLRPSCKAARRVLDIVQSHTAVAREEMNGEEKEKRVEGVQERMETLVTEAEIMRLQREYNARIRNTKNPRTIQSHLHFLCYRTHCSSTPLSKRCHLQILVLEVTHQLHFAQNAFRINGIAAEGIIKIRKYSM